MTYTSQVCKFLYYSIRTIYCYTNIILFSSFPIEMIWLVFVQHKHLFIELHRDHQIVILTVLYYSSYKVVDEKSLTKVSNFKKLIINIKPVLNFILINKKTKTKAMSVNCFGNALFFLPRRLLSIKKNLSHVVLLCQSNYIHLVLFNVGRYHTHYNPSSISQIRSRFGPDLVL